MKFNIEDKSIRKALAETAKFVDLGGNAEVEGLCVRKEGWKLVSATPFSPR